MQAKVLPTIIVLKIPLDPIRLSDLKNLTFYHKAPEPNLRPVQHEQ